MSRALVIAAIFCTSCGVYRHNPPPYRPPIPQTETSGRVAFARDCAWCHGSAGRGTARGPDLSDDAHSGAQLTDLMLRTGRMPLDDPHQRMRRRPAPYDTKQILAIDDYVASLAGGRVRLPHPRDGDLAHGADMYLTNCAACHSTTGIGGALGTGHVPDVAHRQSSAAAPPLDHATSLEVAEAVRNGVGSMPAFGSGTLSDHDVASIVRYVAYLKHPNDKGGASTGHIGPVAEGAVGWIIGLGLLLAFCAWIGTTRRREP